jgi:hypothetical protein
MGDNPKKTDDGGTSQEPALQHIHEALRGLRFGTVTVIVQDGVVIQIDRTEKKRLRRSLESHR